MKMDLIGNRYNKLLVTQRFCSDYRGAATWICKCDCGKEIVVKTQSLTSGHTKSCGCLQKSTAKTMMTTHGEWDGIKTTPEYRAWLAAKARCYNKNLRAYKDYGGRGVIVCDRWVNSFNNFLEDMGRRPSAKHSLDRYPNVDGNYEPVNCRWATREQQARNMRSNIWYEFDGIKLVLSDWAKVLKTVPSSIRFHLEKGKSFEEVAKLFIYKKRIEWNGNLLK